MEPIEGNVACVVVELVDEEHLGSSALDDLSNHIGLITTRNGEFSSESSLAKTIERCIERRESQGHGPSRVSSGGRFPNL